MSATTIDIFRDMKPGFAVECGASGGGDCNPTDWLIQKGWRALLVEVDEEKFNVLKNRYMQFSNNLSFVNDKFTPESAPKILKKNNIPLNFDYLVLDIDSYDYEVLDAILTAGYRPTVIEAEINEKIPYPIQFFVKYGSDVKWDCGHFSGMSLASAEQLLCKHGYRILSSADNNVIAAVADSAYVSESIKAIIDDVRRYSVGADFNADVSYWYRLNADIAVREIIAYFAEKGKGRELYHIDKGE